MKEVKIIPDTILVEIPKDPQTLNKYILSEFHWRQKEKNQIACRMSFELTQVNHLSGI